MSRCEGGGSRIAGYIACFDSQLLCGHRGGEGALMVLVVTSIHSLD